jgi:ribose/xylose/arabinose/galactoside ABC-type transport system permease subunit
MQNGGAEMATIARLLARRIPASQFETDVLKQLTLFACAALVVSFLMMTYGLDLSPGFF